MNHIVDTCPLTKFEYGPSLLHEADDDAVIWLEYKQQLQHLRNNNEANIHALLYMSCQMIGIQVPLCLCPTSKLLNARQLDFHHHTVDQITSHMVSSSVIAVVRNHWLKYSVLE